MFCQALFPPQTKDEKWRWKFLRWHVWQRSKLSPSLSLSPSLLPAVFPALRRCPRPLSVPAPISFRGNRYFFTAIFCRPLRLRVIAVLKCFTVLKKLKRGTLGQFGGKQCLYEISVGFFVMTVGWFSSSLCGNNSVYRTCSITNLTVVIYNLKLTKNAAWIPSVIRASITYKVPYRTETK